MDLKFLLPLEIDFPQAFHSPRFHPESREHQKQFRPQEGLHVLRMEL